MNAPIIASISASLLTGVALLSTLSPVAAQSGGAKFSCGTSQGSPATVVKTSRGNITVIRWVSNVFGEQYSPEYRCRVVSAKFQQYHESGQLNYLTTGTAKGMPVVCVAQVKGGVCSGVLFTLKAGSDPLNTLTRLLNVRVQAGPPLNESSAGAADLGNDRYIDVANFLSSAPTDNSTAAEIIPTVNSQVPTTTPAKGLW